MVESCTKSDGVISEALPHFKIGYVSIRHEDRKAHITRHYLLSPSLHLKGNWLKEPRFDTGCAVKVTEECLIIIAEKA